jgi:L-fuconolactonase
MIVDSHAHVSDRWFEPAETLLHHMDANGVEQAVLVQLLGQTDNRYQQDCRRRWPDRFASVVWIDPDEPDGGRALEELVADGATGVRLRPTARSVGNDPLALWQTAERLGVAVSSPGSAETFAAAEFAELADAVPDLTIDLEHLGTRTGAGLDGELRTQVLSLASHPNVGVKLTGLGEFARRGPLDGPTTFEEPVPTLIEDAVAAFGPSRCMWGSDFPVVSSREGYGNALRNASVRLASCPETERRLLLGANAAATFALARKVSSRLSTGVATRFEPATKGSPR